LNLFVGTYITFLKGYDAGYQMTTKNLINQSSVKKLVEFSVLKAPKIAPKIDFLKNGPWGDFVNTHFRN
jgi:hypothetical protein